MKSLNQFIDSLFSSSSERLKNPIISSIFFSWLIINWDVVLVILFHQAEIIEKISLAKSMVNWIDGVAIPLGAACVYIFALPFLQNWIEGKLKNVTLNRFNRKSDEENDFLIKKIEVAKKQAEYNLALTGANDMEILRAQNEALSKEVNTLRKNLSDQETNNSSLSSENTKLKSYLNKAEQDLKEVYQHIDATTQNERFDNKIKFLAEKYIDDSFLYNVFKEFRENQKNGQREYLAFNEGLGKQLLTNYPSLFSGDLKTGKVQLSENGLKVMNYMFSIPGDGTGIDR